MFHSSLYIIDVIAHRVNKVFGGRSIGSFKEVLIDHIVRDKNKVYDTLMKPCFNSKL